MNSSTSLSTRSGSESISEAVLASLPQSERKVVSASIASTENPKIGDLNRGQFSSMMDSLLLKASVKLGQKKKEGEELKLLIQALSADVMKFPNLTTMEIYLAVDAGLDGNYRRRDDEIILFTPSNFVQWVRAYIEETKKPVMKKTTQVYRKEEVSTPPPSERDSMIDRYRLLVNACIDTFETGKAYQDYGGILYDLLVKIELMSPILESGPEMHAAALWIVNNARDQNDKSKLKQAKLVFDKVLSGVSDESVMSVATRKQVEKKLKEVCGDGEESCLEFLEVAKEKLTYYLENIQQPKQLKE
jgi:hypothetical protein